MGKAVVIGAGLGGLAAAARLSQLGWEVEVFEQTHYLGGRCSCRDFDGVQFNVGAYLFGRRMLSLLKQLGALPTFTPVNLPVRLFYGGQSFQLIPTNVRTLQDQRRLGAGVGDIAQMLWRMGLQMFTRRYSHQAAHAQAAIDAVFHTDAMRDMMSYLTSLHAGIPAETMPALLFEIFMLGSDHGYDHPFYPYGTDSIGIPEALLRAAHGAVVHFECPVGAILIKEGRVSGVRLRSGEEIAADVVVSDLDVRQTAALCLPGSISAGLFEKAQERHPGLPINNIFTLSNHPQREKVVYAASVPVGFRHHFARFVAGEPMTEDAFEIYSVRTGESNRVVVSFFSANGNDSVRLEADAQRILAQVKRLLPGFNPTWQQFVSGADYPARLGVTSQIVSLPEDLDVVKPPRKMPIGGLYNVGVSVQPAASGAIQAVESGLLAANEIVAAY